MFAVWKKVFPVDWNISLLFLWSISPDMDGAMECPHTVWQECQKWGLRVQRAAEKHVNTADWCWCGDRQYNWLGDMNCIGATCLLVKLCAEPHCPERWRTQWALKPLGGSIAQWGEAVFFSNTAALYYCFSLFYSLDTGTNWFSSKFAVNKEPKRKH